MIARERIHQRRRWCRRRQAPLLRHHWDEPRPGRDLGLRACSCFLCDPHKSERKLRLLEKRRAEQLVQEELQAEAEIRSAWEAEAAEGWIDPGMEEPTW